MTSKLFIGLALFSLFTIRSNAQNTAEFPSLNLGADSLNLAVEESDDNEMNKFIHETFSKYYKGKYFFFRSNDTIQADFRYLIIVNINYTGDRGPRTNRTRGETLFSYRILDAETNKFCYATNGSSGYKKAFEQFVMNLEKARAEAF